MNAHSSIKVLILAAAGTLVLAACSGGGSATPTAVKSANTGSGNGATTSSVATVATNWVFKVPSGASAALKKAASATRSPKYVTANIAKVTITLNSVTPGGIPNGLQTSVTTTLTSSCANGCSVPGPSVPPGTDNFTLTTYDSSNDVISTASPTYTITPGSTNDESVTLNGVPASFSIASVPSAAAGTALGATSFTVNVLDADGDTIVGTYENPVTVSIDDTSGATTISTSGSDSPASGTLLSSNDVAQLTYTGLAIPAATISAAATGATSGTATFAPTLSPIVYSGPENGSSQPEIDLYAASGTGSSATFSATEVGWTNSPYNKSITATEAAGCVHIATTAATSATAFTTSVSTNAPAAGTCTMALTDFTGGNTTSVTITNTTSSFGVN